MEDLKYMRLALDLAERWRGKTSPNPLVGAVVVRDKQIVGQGAHHRAGEPHAEVHALREAGELANRSTLYVTLEPCNHYGKTPPCTERIIASGVKRVVVAMEDPNPLVAGKGVNRLRQAGIQVEVGICENDARRSNEIFVKYITTGKPFVILKAATSLDGKIATQTGDSRWITNEEARHRVHQLRAEVDGILIGRETLIQDNPRLNVRIEGNYPDPQKIILSSQLAINPDFLKQTAAYQLATTKPLMLISAEGMVDEKHVKALQQLGVIVELIPHHQGLIDFDQLLIFLGKNGITSLLIEGGQGVYTSFLQAGLVDKVYLFQSPIILGDEGLSWVGNMGFESVAHGIKLKNVSQETYGDNSLTIGYLA